MKIFVLRCAIQKFATIYCTKPRSMTADRQLFLTLMLAVSWFYGQSVQTMPAQDVLLTLNYLFSSHYNTISITLRMEQYFHVTQASFFPSVGFIVKSVQLASFFENNLKRTNASKKFHDLGRAITHTLERYWNIYEETFAHKRKRSRYRKYST